MGYEVLMATHATRMWMILPVAITYEVHESGAGATQSLDTVVFQCRFHTLNTHELPTWLEADQY